MGTTENCWALETASAIPAANMVFRDPIKRDFYAEMCRLEQWSERTLNDKLQSMLSAGVDVHLPVVSYRIASRTRALPHAELLMLPTVF